MGENQKQIISRREFLKASGFALGATATALACGGGMQAVEMTAFPTPTITPALPTPSLAPGEIADTIFINANIITMDAAGSQVEALAVKDGRILRTGTNEAVQELVD